MKKLVALMILVVMSVGVSQVSAQRRGISPESKEKFFMAKMKAIQGDLKMTEEQTNEFVPIYREYEEKMSEIFKSHSKDFREASKDALKWVNERVDMKIKLLELQKEYNEKFAKVLEPQQLLKLERAEQKIQFQIMNRRADKNKNRTKRGHRAPKAQ